MYGLYGLKDNKVEMLPMRDGRTDKQTTRKDRATQLLICEKLSLAILENNSNRHAPDYVPDYVPNDAPGMLHSPNHTFNTKVLHSSVDVL